MERLVKLLKERKITISTIESLTGGLFASKLTEHSGISSVFYGALVTYNDKTKIDNANIDKYIIDEYGAISKQAAEAMVLSCQKLFATDVAVSFTGNAGPCAQEGKAVGLVFSAIAYKKDLFIFEDQLKGSRLTIRNDIINLTVERLLDILGKE